MTRHGSAELQAVVWHPVWQVLGAGEERQSPEGRVGGRSPLPRGRRVDALSVVIAPSSSLLLFLLYMECGGGEERNISFVLRPC